MKLKTIILAIPALSKLAAGDLSLRLAYQLKRLISALQEELDFFAEQRRKIFEKYGAVDGSFPAESESAAMAELDELLELEVTPEVEVLDIPVSENLRLSVNDLDFLAFFVHFIEE